MRFEFGFECQPWNYLTSVEEPQRHSRYWFYPAEISFGVGVHPRGLRTQGRVGFLLLKIWDLSCNSWGNQDGRKTLCNFKGGRGWLAATRKRVLELFMKNKATTRRDGGGGQRNCCFGPLILEIRSWFRSEDLWLGWDQLLKQIVFFFFPSELRRSVILTLSASFLFPMDCHLHVSLLMSAEHSANANIYFGHA